MLTRPDPDTTPLDRLASHPWLFRFDAAVRLVRLATGGLQAGEAIRFTTPISLAQPAAEIEAVDPPPPGNAEGAPRRGRIATKISGLIGVSGPLPRWYTELVAQAARARSPAIADFIDMLAQRLIAGFAEAGVKYRPHLAAEVAARRHDADRHEQGRQLADPLGEILLSLSGFGTGHLVGRMAAGEDALRHYAGFFASRPRSAERLRVLVSDWLGRPVEIEEFAGAWLRVAPDEQSRMPRGRIPGRFNRLGRDCAIGARAFDQQARFVIRIGPLSRADFESLLPDRPLLAGLVALVRAYVGMEVDFAVNPVLDPAEIPPLRLGGSMAPRLSWTGWLPSSSAAFTGGARADQAIFAATVIEAMAERNRAARQQEQRQ